MLLREKSDGRGNWVPVGKSQPPRDLKFPFGEAPPNGGPWKPFYAVPTAGTGRNPNLHVFSSHSPHLQIFRHPPYGSILADSALHHPRLQYSMKEQIFQTHALFPCFY